MRTLAAASLAIALACSQGLHAEQTSPPPKPLDPEEQQPGLQVGEEAPDVRVENMKGETVSLGDLYAQKGPVVLTFYRGGWCPFCNRALQDWQQKVGDLDELGATFVAMSPETPAHAVETIEKGDLDYTVLSDVTGEATRRFRVAFELAPETKKAYKGYGIDLTEYNASRRWELPAPATYIIDRDGIIRYAHASWDYREGRADPDEVLEALRDMQND